MCAIACVQRMKEEIDPEAARKLDEDIEETLRKVGEVEGERG